MRPAEQLPGPPRLVRHHRVACRAELVQQLLEPELVRLVDGDEQQLVMSRRIGLRDLLSEQLGQPEVTAVG